jgi:hypothetical protein
LFATALVLLVGCATEPLPESDTETALDPAVSDPDQAGAADHTAPPPTSQAGAVTEPDRTLDSSAAGGDREPLPGQGEPCPEYVCAKDLTCVRFYGFAGPAGGELTSCEYPCGSGEECPRGQSCTTIYDGPGQVCRPPQ